MTPRRRALKLRRWCRRHGKSPLTWHFKRVYEPWGYFIDPKNSILDAIEQSVLGQKKLTMIYDWDSK